MEYQMIKETDWADLLIEVSNAYNIEIDRLEKENQRLSRLLSESLLFRLERKCTVVLRRAKTGAIEAAKRTIIFFGMKEYVKKTNFYRHYKARRK